MREKKVSLAADPKKPVLKTRACIPGLKRESVVFEVNALINHRCAKMRFNLWFIW